MNSTSMTKREVFSLLEKIKEVYPHFEITQSVIDIWSEILKDANYNRSYKRFVAYAGENEFPPKPADIKAVAPKPNETLGLRDKWRKEAAEVPQETKDEFARRLEELSRKLGSK